MSDYNSYDRYGNPNGPGFEPPDPDGRGPYILLAILVLIGVVGGLLYFNGTPKGGANDQQAQAPISRAVPAPANQPGPGSAAPTMTPTPSHTTPPTNPPADTTK